MPEARSPMAAFAQSVVNVIDGPVTWFRESIVEPNQKKSVWYHQQFRRVPTIDQCYTDDAVCKFEADQQFRRDRLVDNEILSILRLRFEDCMMYEAPDHMKKCKPFMDTYKEAEENWFIKLG
uniref:NADH dehydrogenase [ubiquinone] 1 beta subcomplex subunit 10 n=1 Tax=Megaselia scalaris TaxID=36166 RepID=T1GPH9_MEGSC